MAQLIKLIVDEFVYLFKCEILPKFKKLQKRIERREKRELIIIFRVTDNFFTLYLKLALLTDLSAKVSS